METELKYEGYVRRQLQQNQQLNARGEQRIPTGFRFDVIPGLRPETRQKLAAFAPATVAQASRISGVTPADLAIISIWLMKKRGKTTAAPAEAGAT